MKPEARRDILEALRKAGIKPTAMMDVSDGLSSELLHICSQSNVGCCVYEDKLPIDYEAAAERSMSCSSPARWMIMRN